MSKSTSTSRSLATIGAVSAAVASGIHVVAMPVHMNDSVLAGSFFLAVAAAQAVLAAGLVIGASRRLLAAGFVMTISVLGLWVMSRTIGMPPGTIEPISGPDLAASASELVTLAALGALWLRRTEPRRQRRARPMRPILVTASAVAAAIVFWSPLQGGAHTHAEPAAVPSAAAEEHIDAGTVPHRH